MLRKRLRGVQWSAKPQRGEVAASQGQAKRESKGHFYWYFSHRVVETHVELLGHWFQQHPPARQKTKVAGPHLVQKILDS